jgi:hypothetical protein
MCSFTNATIDSTAHRISMGQELEEVRDYLLALGLSEYDAYLCFKAAKLLLDSGVFYPRKGAR